jgi:hypothetical protein
MKIASDNRKGSPFRLVLFSGALISIALFTAKVSLAQTAPNSFEITDRDAREKVSLGQSQFEYVPGYYFGPLATGDEDYDAETVYRLEYGVNNDGTRSQVPELTGFQLTAGGPTFLPLVSNTKAGSNIREPFDEVIPIRLIDGESADQLQLCSDDNASGQSCADVTNPNKNSFFHAYTSGHRDQTELLGPIDATDGGTVQEQGCYNAYVEFFGEPVPADATCPIVRYQSERVTCFKCIGNSYAIHRGADNNFSKSSGERTRNNIGRLDFIIQEPIVISQLDADVYAQETGGDNILDNVGFLVMERGGNDNISVAPITGIANLDDVANDAADLSGLPSDLQTNLPRLARLIRTYDNPSLELTDTGVDDLEGGNIADGLITPGRSAESIVTELGNLVQTTETTTSFDFWSGTGFSTESSVFMNSNPEDGETGFFIENRPDQDLTTQEIHGTFFSLADLGIGIGDQLFGVSFFAGNVTNDLDLITLTDIPRETPGASGGVGGLDLMGGGGFFFREDVPQNPTELTIGDCWRTLSSPIAGQTYAEFFESFYTDTDETGNFQNFGGLWTQGSEFDGSPITIDGVRSPTGEPNVYTMNSDGTAWEPITNSNTGGAGFNATIPAGTGILISVYEQDDFTDPGSAGFPKKAALVGTEHSAPFTLNLGTEIGTTDQPGGTSTADGGFSLLGNPFKSPLDLGALTRDEVGPNVWVYDRNGGDGPTNGNQGNWISYNINTIAGDISNGRIAPGQGFVVQNTATATSPSVEFTEASKLLIGDESTFYGKQKSRPDHARIEVLGEGVYNSAWIVFSDDASFELMMDDAVQFMPFESEFAILSTMKEGQMLDISNFPYVNEGTDIPLTVETTSTSTLTLRLTDLQYSQSGPLYLYDNVTGESIELFEGMEYEFTPSGSPAKALSSCYSTPQKAESGGDIRFVITSSLQREQSSVFPDEFSLSQNYPNPFNPTTQITYELPVQSDVTLSVYDITGQQVALLVSERVEAGSHTVTFDGSDLSSGIYIYRLRAGSTVLTRKLTLIK